MGERAPRTGPPTVGKDGKKQLTLDRSKPERFETPHLGAQEVVLESFPERPDEQPHGKGELEAVYGGGGILLDAGLEKTRFFYIKNPAQWFFIDFLGFFVFLFFGFFLGFF
jgi:hypothetical protein